MEAGCRHRRTVVRFPQIEKRSKAKEVYIKKCYSISWLKNKVSDPIVTEDLMVDVSTIIDDLEQLVEDGEQHAQLVEEKANKLDSIKEEIETATYEIRAGLTTLKNIDDHIGGLNNARSEAESEDIYL